MAHICDPREQQAVIRALRVSRTFSVDHEIEQRIAFLCQHMLQHDRHSLVLGISGGVDSLAAGLLAQAAVQRCARMDNRECSLRCVCRMACSATRMMPSAAWR